MTVLRKEYITPHMLRVVLTDDLDGFPEEHESANFKLIIPREGQTTIAQPPWTDDTQPTVRTYTLRRFDKDAAEVHVDFLMFGEPGPGGTWAKHAEIGDKIGFAGPGPATLPDPEADWFLIGGDMAALPAAGAILERLPKDAKGYAIFDVLSEEDIQDIDAPEGMNFTWRIDPDPNTFAQGFVDAIESTPWLPGSPAVWIAGEGGAMRAVRRIMKKERTVERSRLYVSAYWEIGMNEDRHQVVKRAELED